MGQMIMHRGMKMVENSIAMLDKDHHIHLIPVHRMIMMSIEHSMVKKIENERFGFECYRRLVVEGVPHPLEDVIKMSFAAAKLPGPEMMMDLVFVQNHIIKIIFDTGLAGKIPNYIPDDPLVREYGITLSSEIKRQMLASEPLKEVLERYGALPETMEFVH
jgi:hypothetical protein